MTRKNLSNVLTPNMYGRLDNILNSIDKPLIIAGSGPSLQRINYKRLPKDFLTFRINNFFLEDKYYLGKNVDLCYESMPRPQTIYTLMQNITEDFYQFNNDFFLTSDVISERFPKKEFFPYIDVEKILSLDIKISAYLGEVYYYQKKHVTSGILSLLTSIVLGFKEIYLVGIDFYSDDNRRYAYKIGENYKNALNKEDLQPGYCDTYHSREIDLKGLDLALSYNNINIRSICDDAFINNFIPLAEERKEKNPILKDKPKDYIDDYIVPKITVDKESWKQKFFVRTGIYRDVNEFKKTYLVKFLYSFFIKPFFVIPIRIIIKFFKNFMDKKNNL